MTTMSSDPFRLDGQVALITGGGTGIGFGIAEAFVTAGAQVVLAGRREGVLAEAAGRLGPRAHVFVHDVTAGDAAALVKQIESAVGSVTCLVNAAGNHLKKPAAETSDEEFERIIRTHLTGALALTRAVIPGMVARRSGSILFIASMATFLGIPGVVAYAAAKSGVGGIVRTLAAELSPHNVRINAIAPGWIDSPMLRQALAGDDARRDRILQRTPMNRFGTAREIGLTAVFLASEAASFITGAMLPVDGGASIGF